MIRPQGYKTFPILISAEHEILSANKQQLIDKYNVFLLILVECEISYAYEYENANIS